MNHRKEICATKLVAQGFKLITKGRRISLALRLDMMPIYQQERFGWRVLIESQIVTYAAAECKQLGARYSIFLVSEGFEQSGWSNIECKWSVRKSHRVSKCSGFA